MRKMYRINYVVDINGASCTIYTYPILEEKKTYFVIRSGRYNRHIKKCDIGEIKSIDVYRTGFYVFLTDLEKQSKYIEQMIGKIKENALIEISKFQSIYEKVNICKTRVVDVEIE